MKLDDLKNGMRISMRQWVDIRKNEDVIFTHKITNNKNNITGLTEVTIRRTEIFTGEIENGIRKYAPVQILENPTITFVVAQDYRISTFKKNN